MRARERVAITVEEAASSGAEGMAAFMSGVLNSLQANVILCDAALRIVEVNAAARETLKRLRSEIGGSMPADPERLAGESLLRFVPDPQRLRAILDDPALLPYDVEVSIGSKAFRTRIDALRGPGAEVSGYTIVCEDVTSLRAAREDLRASQLQRETLQREVHRRVRNSLEMVTGMVRLAGDVPSGDALPPAWAPSWIERLRAISRVHELIYDGEDVSRVDLDAYVRELIREVVAEHASEEGRIRIETAVHAEIRDLDALIVFGLALGELAANAVKHAFPGERRGCIRVTARRNGGAIEAVVSDDGVGFPEETVETKGFGLRLVTALIEDRLKGTLKIESGASGTTCLLSMPAGPA